MKRDYQITVTCSGGTHIIPIEYERKRRRKLILRVYPRTARVVFSVPLNTPDAYALDFFRQHTLWLEKQLQKILPLLPPRHTYSSGDCFYYLGKPLTLECSRGEVERAQAADEKIILLCKEESSLQRRKALLAEMFDKLLPPLITDSLARLLSSYAPLLDIFSPPSFKIRKMTSRWGVCRPLKNEICLSSRLVHLPLRLIDYVVAHELCHFKFFDHSPRFWRLLGEIEPKWRECRQELNRMDAYIDI